MKFPLVRVDAGADWVEFERRRHLGLRPNLAVRLHGKTVEKLGEWDGYAAIRCHGCEPYELIHPRYLATKQKEQAPDDGAGTT